MHGLCYSEVSSTSSCMTHEESGNIHMADGMRLPMSEEDKFRNSGYPQDEGATVLAHP